MSDEFRTQYVQMIRGVIRSIDSLLSEIEQGAIHNDDLRKVSLEMAMDSVPLARCLREARKQAEVTLMVYEGPSKK